MKLFSTAQRVFYFYDTLFAFSHAIELIPQYVRTYCRSGDTYVRFDRLVVHMGARSVVRSVVRTKRTYVRTNVQIN